MSGRVHVRGFASTAAGASAHGGLLVIDGDASLRCGISLKGADIVVRGSVGHMSAFMGQRGCVVVCGDAGESLGDSLYEARLYVLRDHDCLVAYPLFFRPINLLPLGKEVAGCLADTVSQLSSQQWLGFRDGIDPGAPPGRLGGPCLRGPLR